MTLRASWKERRIIGFFFIFIVMVMIISPVTAACSPGYQSCKGMCYDCPSGTILGSDCKCHKPCGNSNNYCTSGSCCGGDCLSCPSGSILGSDCKCHTQTSNSNDNSDNLAQDPNPDTEDTTNWGKIGVFLAKIAKIIAKII